MTPFAPTIAEEFQAAHQRGVQLTIKDLVEMGFSHSEIMNEFVLRLLGNEMPKQDPKPAEQNKPDPVK
jgi:hypothetical protein